MESTENRISFGREAEQSGDSAMPISWLTYLGQELRVAREQRGWSVRHLAAHTSYSYQQVSNVETGRRTPSGAFVKEVDAALETGGRFTRLLRRVLTDALPYWFQGAAREEAKAIRIQTYQPQVVHGLLQTEAYARALLRSDPPRSSSEGTEALLAARLARQSILKRKVPPYFWLIMDEAALHLAVGGREVMAEQLERLLAEEENPNIMIQILPFSAGAHPGTNGPFILWSYEDRSDVLYVEGLLTATIVEKAADLESARLSYDLLQAAALPRKQSFEMIRDALKGYTT